MRKIRRVITAASTIVAIEILTHRKFIKLQYNTVYATQLATRTMFSGNGVTAAVQNFFKLIIVLTRRASLFDTEIFKWRPSTQTIFFLQKSIFVLLLSRDLLVFVGINSFHLITDCCQVSGIKSNSIGQLTNLLDSFEGSHRVPTKKRPKRRIV